jgi:hypothetical protein
MGTIFNQSFRHSKSVRGSTELSGGSNIGLHPALCTDSLICRCSYNKCRGCSPLYDIKKEERPRGIKEPPDSRPCSVKNQGQKVAEFCNLLLIFSFTLHFYLSTYV